ncbi:uncharacterized protein PITG_22905 [Phytophthora infestans T30-4]|uniref:Secreted protein n=1 Tax=Phytophthora infestans (strain T30-4) TaxID=403677 RepID=D0NE10_PHYIT|nr:uncharacterized protein PITG_22905 [Phytophthora infestans T30-4]EEY56455.1 conserved hypothetical protein [Phytophthora infestans T30-4]|eukprot:XP_002902529.1 conserved hypothetical protein [Phytophthora infestans T30-4]
MTSSPFWLACSFVELLTGGVTACVCDRGRMDVKLLCGALREAASRLSESGDAASPAPPPVSPSWSCPLARSARISWRRWNRLGHIFEVWKRELRASSCVESTSGLDCILEN